MADSGPNIAPFLNLAVQIIQASGGDTKRADEAAHILASSTAVNTYPAVEALVKALEASRQKHLDDGLWESHETIVMIEAAISSFRSLQDGGAN